MTDEKNRLQATFDRVAPLDEARPGYPEELFDDVVSLSGVPREGRILEIGCGTGQATAPLARRGYRILCVELGANLAAVARRKLAAYPQVEVRTGAFEDWAAEKNAFDLAVSAAASSRATLPCCTLPTLVQVVLERLLRAREGQFFPRASLPGWSDWQRLSNGH